MTTQRQQIMDALGSLLDSVSGLTYGATPWQLDALDVDQLPAAVYKDGAASTEKLAGGLLQHSLPIEIDFLARGDFSDQQIRSLAGEILSSLAKDPLLGDLLSVNSFGGFDMAGDQADDTLAAGRLTFDLLYETPLWQI